MSLLPVTLAAGPYDRTRALADGRVTVAGADLRYITLDPEEIFFRMVGHGEFDVSEMSLATYHVIQDRARQSQEPAPFVAIPVFPSRLFRHTSVYVNRSRLPAGNPKALDGAIVGVAEWQLTANVWIRGILADHYGVPVESVRYRTGGLNAPGRHEKVPLAFPPGIDIAPIADGKTLSAMLAAGEIDAIYSPRAPVSSGPVSSGPVSSGPVSSGTASLGTGNVTRLFEDSRAEEERYFAATGIFPIMHVIVIRRPVYEANRWLARELLKSFTAAKRIAYEDLARTAALAISLPFAREEFERAVAVMGSDYWSYGVEPNRHVLAAFARYAAAQHLVTEAQDPESLFAPETLDEVVI
jgi:4,5-dihydroxyphthalate decarboxylase